MGTICLGWSTSDVEVAGFAANTATYMSRAALLVLSSRHEGLGNVLIEALACGCPVVSTGCSYGPAEILDHGRYGRLVPVGDSEAMAAAILATLDEPPNRERLRARGAEFTFERAADAYLDLLFPLARRSVAGRGTAGTADRILP
jgi:glycosyltransferase involved in cell wall biosynthesis